MLYTSDQIIADVRSDLFDRADIDDAGNARDTLWSDVDLLRYLNSAAARWASDTLALRKRFVFDVLASDPLVKLPLDEVLDVLTVGFVSPVLGTRSRELVVFDIHEGINREDYGNWGLYAPDLAHTGTPSHFTRDFDNKYLRIYPVPVYAGVLTISAIVLPTEIFDGAPLPFTSPLDRDLVLMWMKKLAYEKQDADTIDLTRARDFEAQYKRSMPDRRSEIDRVRRDGGILQARW